MKKLFNTLFDFALFCILMLCAGVVCGCAALADFAVAIADTIIFGKSEAKQLRDAEILKEGAHHD